MGTLFIKIFNTFNIKILYNKSQHSTTTIRKKIQAFIIINGKNPRDNG